MKFFVWKLINYARFRVHRIAFEFAETQGRQNTLSKKTKGRKGIGIGRMFSQENKQIFHSFTLKLNEVIFDENGYLEG